MRHGFLSNAYFSFSNHLKDNFNANLNLAPYTFLILSLMLCLSGCRPDEYQNVKIVINRKIYTFEVAATDEQRKRGLMFRKEIDENSGMLFVYPQEMPLRFFMKNTHIPLDIAFIDKNGTIIHIESMVPLNETVIPSKMPAKYALEVNRGFFQKTGLDAGDQLQFLTPVSSVVE